MRAHVSALIVKEFGVDGEDFSLCVDRSLDGVMLLARVIAGDEVLAAIRDPFYGTP